MGLFSRKQTPETEPRTADADVQQTQPGGAEASGAAQQLPESGPLRSLVDGLLVDGAERAKLTLVQRGSTMSYQSERAAAGGSPETDSGVVDQASPLFDDVAALYTESMNSSTGAWQTVVISAGAPEADGRRVSVDYDFPAAEHRTEEYRVAGGSAQAGSARGDSASQDRSEESAQDGARTGATAAGAGAGAAAAAGSSDQSAAADQHRTQETGAAEEQADLSAESRQERRRESEALADQAKADEPAQTEQTRAAEARDTEVAGSAAPGTAAQGTPDRGAEAQEADTEQRSAGAGAAGAAAGAAVGAGAAGVASGGSNDQRVPEGQLTQDGTVDNLAPREQGQEPIEVDREVQESVARTAGHQSAAGSGTGEQVAGVSGAESSQADGEQVPSHVDHEEWRDDRSAQRSTAAAPTGAAAAQSVSGADGAGAPTIASGADVAPSYRAAEQASGGEDLAQGNKVLAQKEIARRVAGAQKRLFGADGSARDVSTVLIRVRTLGTYYDALTHVRQGGFWDQRSTFDLIPEEDLQVQALKQDSYVEGEGAPLAIMFRFRPGIPPEVSFDYDDEEAFVRYENRLPSQNYVEELRMYPRTGANIPQHMNDALQDWNY